MLRILFALTGRLDRRNYCAALLMVFGLSRIMVLAPVLLIHPGPLRSVSFALLFWAMTVATFGRIWLSYAANVKRWRDVGRFPHVGIGLLTLAAAGECLVSVAPALGLMMPSSVLGGLIGPLRFFSLVQALQIVPIIVLAVIPGQGAPSLPVAAAAFSFRGQLGRLDFGVCLVAALGTSLWVAGMPAVLATLMFFVPGMTLGTMILASWLAVPIFLISLVPLLAPIEKRSRDIGVLPWVGLAIVAVIELPILYGSLRPMGVLSLFHPWQISVLVLQVLPILCLLLMPGRKRADLIVDSVPIQA